MNLHHVLAAAVTLTLSAAAPAAHAATPAARASAPRIIHIDSPRMTVFLPAKSAATGRAVVDLPGGGYSLLATSHEGWDWAPYFNDMGIALAVVEYTMPKGNRELPYRDAVAAVKMMRDSATAWGINPQEVGIMGSSAGGHLATTVATHAPAEERPDFQILFYPVVSMKKGLTHGGSRSNLLGKDAAEADVLEYSNELKVTAATPRALLLLSSDDTTVDPANSVLYYEALRAAAVPAAMAIYPTGGHGWGYKPTFAYRDAMLAQLRAWLAGF